MHIGTRFIAAREEPVQQKVKDGIDQAGEMDTDW